jgi:molybdenum cofactor biosynthesis enzyme MoaA
MPGGFWISCLHEPTLHPQLVNFIETVPEVYRDRISFTTNLSRRMDADLLSRLAHSGVHEIRVSLDSLNAEVFSNLRRKAKFDVFMKNLLDLSAALKQGHKRSGLRFITMALKDNSREIPDIVRFGRDLGADAHEVRYMYYEPHLARWGKDHILDLAEWANLEQSLAPLASDTLVFGGPTAERIQQFQEERGLENYAPREAHFGKNELPTTIPDPVRAGALFHHIPLRLHLRWDGLIIAADEPETDFSVDFGLLEQPDAYFNAIRFYAANGHLGGSGL